LKKGLNRRATPLGRPYNSGSRRGNPMWLPVFFNKLPVFFNKMPLRVPTMAGFVAIPNGVSDFFNRILIPPSFA